jgi:stress-induced morphogen
MTSQRAERIKTMLEERFSAARVSVHDDSARHAAPGTLSSR